MLSSAYSMSPGRHFRMSCIHKSLTCWQRFNTLKAYDLSCWISRLAPVLKLCVTQIKPIAYKGMYSTVPSQNQFVTKKLVKQSITSTWAAEATWFAYFMTLSSSSVFICICGELTRAHLTCKSCKTIWNGLFSVEPCLQSKKRSKLSSLIQVSYSSR